MSLTDITLLKVFSARQNYDDYIDQVNLDLLDFEIRDLLISYRVYFDAFEKDEIDFSNFLTWFSQGYQANMQEATYKTFQAIVGRISFADDCIVEDIVKKFHETNTAEKIRDSLEEGFNGEKITTLVTEHESLIGTKKTHYDFISNNLEEIMIATDRSNGLRWKLDCLNETIGPLSKGMFVLVAAYVDVGKTIFGISEAVHMAKQLTEPGDCILWLNNEEDDRRVQEKIWRSALNCGPADLHEHISEAKLAYKEQMNGDQERLKFIDIRSKSIIQIKGLLKTYKPKLVVIDQVDKITANGHKSFSDHDRLKNLWGEIRALCNEFCAVIGISQADATTIYLDQQSGEMKYQMYPHHRQLDGSKVGKPGEADAIIMIGRRNTQNVSRGIHVSKNKFGTVIKKEVGFDGKCASYFNPKHGVSYVEAETQEENSDD